MNLKAEEIIAVFAGGLIAGLVLAWIEKTFPTSGVTKL
jgi:hypothetical protein